MTREGFDVPPGLPDARREATALTFCHAMAFCEMPDLPDYSDLHWH